MVGEESLLGEISGCADLKEAVAVFGDSGDEVGAALLRCAVHH